METGTIPLEECVGGLDLYRTLESGQSYLWRRSDGEMYSDSPAPDAWYSTVVDGEVVRARLDEGAGVLEWASTTDADALVRELLCLEDDLEEIVANAPDDPLLEDAYEAHRGMRLVDDPAFGCLISFICSTQMRVSRIHTMVSTLAREYGTPIEFDGETYSAFPTPEELATATEAQLRDLGLGYRAPYVVRTAEMVAGGEAHPEDARDLEYEAARDFLTRFVGVGDKVADCVLLFSLGFDEAVPLDTWLKSAVEEYYPDCDKGSYAATSRAIRERLGGEYAGYAQTYIFHHLRTGD
ncbi:DNA-3-methyladenine glycosylase family protein [Natronolimnohabitans innermongolicus]|uniref:DNA-(apurinic or apyrimidinic site) lyase n=1 Tax=Natronolimnohabitans innermongolicus JCM 12255 TaxID=1227499 RepID=L9WJ81_9EURY|nr:DNA glycosylase [Natronolimnohabitans innermongolicus]ELY49296.1 8-oxoguanine DNA glycosylase domain-containing protein [Natronolimnohabitans innermongolicus JCM 12255]